MSSFQEIFSGFVHSKESCNSFSAQRRDSKQAKKVIKHFDWENEKFTCFFLKDRVNFSHLSKQIVRQTADAINPLK